MPGALSLPFTSLVQADDVTTFKSASEIRDAFKDAGTNTPSQHILPTIPCNSLSLHTFFLNRYYLWFTGRINMRVWCISGCISVRDGLVRDGI